MNKTCTRCGVTYDQPEFAFPKWRGSRDGFHTPCLRCKRESYSAGRDAVGAPRRFKLTPEEKRAKKAVRDRSYYQEHRESRKEYEVQRRADPRVIERRRETRSRWYEANRERMRAWHRERWQRDREKMSAYRKAYHKAHPEVAREASRNRKAWKRGANGRHSLADLRRQYAAQMGLCYWCDVSLGRKWHADHVMPVTLGGSNGPENIVLACPTCNHRKYARHPQEWNPERYAKFLASH